MNDPATFLNFLENVLQVRPARVREEVITFVKTFEDLLSSSDDEIDAFVKEVHASNSARASNAKLLIGSSVILGLKSVLFELKDRQACGALPNALVLNALDTAQISIMRKSRRQALMNQSLRKDVSLPDMKVPKLTAQTFDDWNTSFTSVVSRQTSLAGISLDYLLRDVELGNYEANWPTREEKLKHCLVLAGSRYKSDTESLYSLLVEHIGTSGCGSNLVIKHKRFKDGRQCYQELKSHFHNEAYKQNLATTANKSLSEVKYYGERRNFTLETYYDIMSKNFNMLELAGIAHLLTEEQKIIKFESGLKEDKAINYSITSKSIWDSLPENEKTFDAYYNTFSSFMNKHNTLVQAYPRKAQISRTNTLTQGKETYQNKRSRFRNTRGRGRGRSSGRARSYNPYAMSRSTKYNFQPEAKVYSREEYNNLTATQKGQVLALKKKNGWVDGYTPPPGFQINKMTGEAEATNQLVSTIRAATSSISQQASEYEGNNTNVRSLPPAIVGHGHRTISDTTSTHAGVSFGRPGRRQSSTNNSTISSVTVNGKTYEGPVYDDRGNRLA